MWQARLRTASGRLGRIALAVVFGEVIVFSLMGQFDRFVEPLWRRVMHWLGADLYRVAPYHEHVWVAIAMLLVLVPALAATTLVIGATRIRPPRASSDGFTRCGGCDHVLRGLTEPRCPECGMRI